MNAATETTATKPFQICVSYYRLDAYGIEYVDCIYDNGEYQNRVQAEHDTREYYTDLGYDLCSVKAMALTQAQYDNELNAH